MLRCGSTIRQPPGVLQPSFLLVDTAQSCRERHNVFNIFFYDYVLAPEKLVLDWLTAYLWARREAAKRLLDQDRAHPRVILFTAVAAFDESLRLAMLYGQYALPTALVYVVHGLCIVAYFFGEYYGAYYLFG